MRTLLFLVCFLIISCDLPSEADKDCNGDSGGVAALDDCGVCSGGDTVKIEESKPTSKLKRWIVINIEKKAN